MATINNCVRLTREDLPGVSIYSWQPHVEAGRQQDVLVEVGPDCVIPLHAHSVDATMIIVGGEGFVLSADESLHGRRVQKGDIVFFEPQVPHGFRALATGLSFISRNGGIIDNCSEKWDIKFSEPDVSTHSH